MDRPVATRHLGLDLGATNLKWAVVERRGDAWETIERHQVPTRAADGADSVVARMTALARNVAEGHPEISSVGVGVPGLYDPVSGRTRLLTNMPGGWIDQPVAEPMEAAMGVACSLVNDARAFGLAELRLGAGRGARCMVGFTLGTGIGGVIAIDGAIHHGHDGTAGELGHQTIDPDGPWCTCGNRGCLEAYARADQIGLSCGTRTAEEAATAAAGGDGRARAGLAEIGRYLGIGIANIVVALTPDRVVIGGGVAAAAELLLEPIRHELRRRVFVTDVDRVEVTAAELGTWAGAIGAAIHGAEAAARAAPRPA